MSAAPVRAAGELDDLGAARVGGQQRQDVARLIDAQALHLKEDGHHLGRPQTPHTAMICERCLT